jgi:hypothetical protein
MDIVRIDYNERVCPTKAMLRMSVFPVFVNHNNNPVLLLKQESLTVVTRNQTMVNYKPSLLPNINFLNVLMEMLHFEDKMVLL